MNRSLLYLFIRGTAHCFFKSFFNYPIFINFLRNFDIFSNSFIFFANSPYIVALSIIQCS